MIGVAITIIFGYLLVQAIGYVTHRLLHTPWTGPLCDAHLDHHLSMYPPSDYLSYKYRAAKMQNRAIWYYLPPALVVIFAAFYFLPSLLACVFSIELILIAVANDWLHTQIHIRGHWLEKFKWFHRVRYLHWHHHVNEEKNNGIFSWFTDKLFGTFEEPTSEPTYLEEEEIEVKKIPLEQ